MRILSYKFGTCEFSPAHPLASLLALCLLIKDLFTLEHIFFLLRASYSDLTPRSSSDFLAGIASVALADHAQCLSSA